MNNKPSEETLQRIVSILTNANPDGSVRLEFNEFKLYYDESPKEELNRYFNNFIITAEERERCLSVKTMWCLTLAKSSTDRVRYVASTLDGLVEIYSCFENILIIDNLQQNVEAFSKFIEIPYLSYAFTRDAHASSDYTTYGSNGEEVHHRNQTIQQYLEDEAELCNDRKPSDDATLKLYQSEHLWQYQIYPRTPVGFWTRNAATLRELLSDLPRDF